MPAHGGVEEIVLFRQPDRRDGGLVRRALRDHGFHIAGQAVEDLFPVRVEAVVVQMGVGIDDS